MNAMEAFLLGMIVMECIVAGVFFLKFWRSTRDLLFAAFAAFFFLDAADRSTLLKSPTPNAASNWYYVVRLFGFLLILAAILRKNYGSQN